MHQKLLENYDVADIVPESEGLTVGGLKENYSNPYKI